MVVSVYEKKSRDLTALLQWLEFVIVSITLTLLLLEFLFIFRPLERQIMRSQEEVELQKAELEVAYLQSKQSEVLKNEFLSNMGHEFRTPLNAILGFSDILRSDQNINQESKNFAHQINESGHHLQEILENILRLSQMQSGKKISLDQHNFALAALTNELIELYQGKAKSKGLEFSILIDPDLFQERYGDLSLIRQVLSNLLDNAIKFTAEGGVSLTVSGGENPHDVFFMVRHTGPGIPTEKANDMFDLFSQADGSSQRKHGGVGIGLALVHKSIRTLNGRIEILPNQPHGTMIEVVIPLPPAQ